MAAILPILVFFPMLAAAVSYLIGRKNKTARSIFAALVCAVLFIAALVLFVAGTDASFSVGGVLTGALRFTLDGFRRLYLLVVTFAWAVSAFFSLQYFGSYKNRNRYYAFFLLTLGAVLGVFLASDLLTAFVFFEMASFTSFVWVIHDQTEGAIAAAKTYLFIAIIGGLVMFMGLLLLWRELGTLEIGALREAAASVSDRASLRAAGICVLVGFGAKAGIFPLHIWLPKAHPVAPAPASALLSGILTKIGIFGVIALSAGAFYGDEKWGKLLLVLGVITMALGGVMALFSVNLKRTVACSSVSQIGFIVVGIAASAILAEENSLAVSGTVLHMLNHSLFKLSLFTAAGVVYMNIHRLDLNDVRGFGRGKPALLIAFLIGALGIGGVPLFSGYISKTLLHEALLECSGILSAGLVKCAECLFLFSGGCTLAYMTKLFVVLFVEKNAKRQKEFDAKKPCMNGVSAFVLLLSSAATLTLGVPAVADGIAKGAVDFLGGTAKGAEYFSFEALKGAVICIVIAVVLYFAVVRGLTVRNGRYVNIIPDWLDLENSVYKPLLALLAFIGSVVGRAVSNSTDRVAFFMRKTVLSASVGRLMNSQSDSAVYQTAETTASQPRVRRMFAGSPITDAAGHIMDRVTHKHKFVLYFAKIRGMTFDVLRRISESFSFALIMTCIGVCVLLVYLLFANR